MAKFAAEIKILKLVLHITLRDNCKREEYQFFVKMLRENKGTGGYKIKTIINLEKIMYL